LTQQFLKLLSHFSNTNTNLMVCYSANVVVCKGANGSNMGSTVFIHFGVLQKKCS